MKFKYMGRKLFYIPLVAILLQRSWIYSLNDYSIFELNINQGIYEYVSRYHVQLLSQCTKQ